MKRYDIGEIHAEAQRRGVEMVDVLADYALTDTKDRYLALKGLFEQAEDFADLDLEAIIEQTEKLLQAASAFYTLRRPV